MFSQFTSNTNKLPICVWKKKNAKRFVFLTSTFFLQPFEIYAGEKEEENSQVWGVEVQKRGAKSQALRVHNIKYAEEQKKGI